MRHSFFCFTAAVFSVALSLTSCSSSAASADAQPSSELKAFDVRSEWKRNPFTFFDGDGLLLAVGKKDNMNAMTIGWGQLGSLWGMDRPVVTVFVRKSRYTDAFMAKNDYFTVSGFSSKFSDALRYMGTHSGREGDKVKATGLRVEFSKLGNPLFSDADIVLECKKIYQAPFQPSGFGDVACQVYKRDTSLHNVYIGEVVNAWSR